MVSPTIPPSAGSSTDSAAGPTADPAAAAVAAVASDKRATGWKIPLLFCAAMLAAVALTAQLRKDDSPVPDVPAPLLEQARAIVIDLNQTPEGHAWKELISATAGGFIPRADKDIKIGNLVRNALEQGHFDAACTAAVLMYNDHKRDEHLVLIAQKALSQCDSLPWGVMAAKGMTNTQQTAKTHLLLTEEWQRCQKQKY